MLLQNVQDEFAEVINTENMQTNIVTPAANIMIYRATMLANLIQTLRDIYPLIEKLVAEDFFRAAAKEYIELYPSLSGNLHDYGEYFSHFLADYPPVRKLPYLAEIANFEWACHLLHFAGDATGLDVKMLGSVSPDQFRQLRFTLHPACRVMRFYYPVQRIVELCKGERDEDINLSAGGVFLLLMRRDCSINLVSLTEAEFTFLSALSRNETLGDALDQAMVVDAEFKLDVALPGWIREKIIVDFSLSPV
jgi:hypothetical protein